MASMNSGKLSELCSQLNSVSKTYCTNVQSKIVDMQEKFNEIWVANDAKNLANEIHECVDTLATEMAEDYNNKNRMISNAVDNFNSAHEESISYPGFNFGTPVTVMHLNDKLPNGHVGVFEEATLNQIQPPMDAIKETVNRELNRIVEVTSSCDAFDSGEINALVSGVQSKAEAFNSKWTKLSSSLEERLAGEQQKDDSLDDANRGMLQN